MNYIVFWQNRIVFADLDDRYTNERLRHHRASFSSIHVWFRIQLSLLLSFVQFCTFLTRRQQALERWENRFFAQLLASLLAASMTVKTNPIVEFNNIKLNRGDFLTRKKQFWTSTPFWRQKEFRQSIMTRRVSFQRHGKWTSHGDFS